MNNYCEYHDIECDYNGSCIECPHNTHEDVEWFKYDEEKVENKQKIAHWIDNHNGTISCSHCNTWFHKDDRYSYLRYCPYCNAKMIESEE